MRDLADVDHGDFRHALLQLSQTGVDEALPFFRGMILGIFAQIAMSSGFENFFGKIVPELILKGGDFLFQFFPDVQHEGSTSALHYIGLIAVTERGPSAAKPSAAFVARRGLKCGWR